jgi:DNA ligase-1
MDSFNKSRSATYYILLSAALFAPLTATDAAPPPLALANDYDDADIDLARYWVSEKYDGVRAYWDGRSY